MALTVCTPVLGSVLNVMLDAAAAKRCCWPSLFGLAEHSQLSQLSVS
jgi:hypothetical protein